MSTFEDLQQLLARYAFAHDLRRPDVLAGTLASDARLLGAEGRDRVVEAFRAVWAAQRFRRKHVFSNHLLLQESADEASMMAYETFFLIREGAVDLHVTGIYRTFAVREDEDWKLRTFLATMDAPYDPGDAPPRSEPSTYDADDPRSDWTRDTAAWMRIP